jgi:CRISPR/Cas system-associated protein Cas10 (large subunit of type III CRISPR-Cas system)
LLARFDTSQPPYRILFQREVNTSCLLIATADTENIIENAWKWIVEKMIPQLDHIDDPYDKEEWVASKIQHIVTSIGSIYERMLKKSNGDINMFSTR